MTATSVNASYNNFFAQYLDAYNKALSGHVHIPRLRSFFTDQFLAAGPDSVNTGKNDFFFSMGLRKTYAFYRKIGTQRLSIRNLEITEIDDFHDMVKVFYQADYLKDNGSPVAIDFNVTYFLQRHGHEIKIFSFVAGDEMQAYKEAGLV